MSKTCFVGQWRRSNDAWHFMSETRLKDGKVLLTGGFPNNDQATTQEWIYRPKRGCARSGKIRFEALLKATLDTGC